MKKLQSRNQNRGGGALADKTFPDSALNKIIKKHVALAVMSFFAVLIVATGVSYSLFQIDKKNTTNQKVQIGTLDSNIYSISGNIILNDLYPQKESDITEEDLTYYFMIYNDGTFDVEYEVYLKDGTLSLLTNSNEYSSYKQLSSEHYKYINYKLDGKKAKNLESIKEGDKFVLFKGVLAAGWSEDHTLQFFLDNRDTTDTGAPNDISGSVLSLDIYYDGAIEQITNMMMAQNDNEAIWQHKENIKSITFENEMNEKIGATYTYDISAKQNSSVITYMVPSPEDETMFDVYIQSDGVTHTPYESDFLFQNFINLEKIDGLENLDTGYTTSMIAMFNNCRKLTVLDLSNFDTSRVINMGSMFSCCSSLTTLNMINFDTSNVTNMNNMFYECSSLASLDLSSFDTSNVTDMQWMFYKCSSLASLDLSSFDTGNVTDMSQMFFNCKALTTLDLRNFDTSNVTDMRYMFYECNALTTLDISSFDTSNVTNMAGMFYACYVLKVLDVSNFDTHNVTNMSEMFSVNYELTTLDLSNFDTKNVTSMYRMFGACISLKSLNLSNFDTSKVTDMSLMFNACSSLTTTITIKGTLCTKYDNMFDSVATNSGAQITVNYTADASSLVDNMIATKASNSNVVKGTQVA